MLVHPHLHRDLLALREEELARRARTRWYAAPDHHRGPARRRAAILLRLVADRLDTRPGGGPGAGPAVAEHDAPAVCLPPRREEISRLASLLTRLDERAPSLFLGRRSG